MADDQPADLSPVEAAADGAASPDAVDVTAGEQGLEDGAAAAASAALPPSSEWAHCGMAELREVVRPSPHHPAPFSPHLTSPLPLLIPSSAPSAAISP